MCITFKNALSFKRQNFRKYYINISKLNYFYKNQRIKILV
ncbi:hypothetical protein HMPREF0201_00253 [Cedecea davisae DSM 4568]|uniref:Uncharacterized protein n=1 Tax=Cedecea davisae DSM 4568 TaxID=566551 RepID=S3JK31_9ENTR|nr:hypothetical protein HMPREF0201_00253 [Cedecea davisae DSM 4568]